jgi:hypothetical protein
MYLGNDDGNEQMLHCLRSITMVRTPARFRKASGVRRLADRVASVRQMGHLTRHAGKLKQRSFLKR